jgi:AAA domain/Bifunctional DNA primase/polymerase, N-terminal/Primase C terminal 2 (PriCT-2)
MNGPARAAVALGVSGITRRSVAPAESTAVLGMALWLAGQGIPVFPCHPGDDPTDPLDPKAKRPLTEHGFKNASTDAQQIRRWWARWPKALVGVPTGTASGLVVIDIDPDGIDFLLAHDDVATGRQHNTRRGFHFIFRVPGDLRIRCSQSKLAKGVDVRADGGYIIWWPAAGFDVFGPGIGSLPPVPASLLQLLSKDASGPTSLSAPPCSGEWKNTPDGLQRLEVALSKRDADCGYGEWIRAGMALHHESRGSEDGFRIWDNWSKRGAKKYLGADDLRPHWNSFSSPLGKNVVTGGTILRDDVAIANDFVGQEENAITRRFVAVPDHQFVGRPPLAWHIKGVLPRAELVVLFGASGSGKSFLAFDIVAAVATGSCWHGRRTVKGRVMYVVAEGATGFLNRLKAYAKARSGTLPGIQIIADAPNLLSETDPVSLATEIEAAGGADLIVIDTLAVCSPGADENAAKDMGRVIEHCKQLHKATRATVLLIHHSGKDDSKGARGWSGLRAAADAEIEVSRHTDHRAAKVTKMKDGEEGAEFAFKLTPVEIGVDDDGDPETSCVVEQLAVPPKGTRKEPRPGSVERTLLDAIRDVPSADQRASVPGVIQAAMSLMPQPEGRDTRRQHLMRAMRTLGSKGFVAVEGDACHLL